VKRLAFEEYAAHRLWLDVFERNLRAIHLYAAEGFIMEGRLRECYRRDDGSFASLLVLSILRQDYLAWDPFSPCRETEPSSGAAAPDGLPPGVR
jgi:RimJ/RimL family protein N-acetyltransferase